MGLIELDWFKINKNWIDTELYSGRQSLENLLALNSLFLYKYANFPGRGELANVQF